MPNDNMRLDNLATILEKLKTDETIIDVIDPEIFQANRENISKQYIQFHPRAYINRLLNAVRKDGAIALQSVDPFFITKCPALYESMVIDAMNINPEALKYIYPQFITAHPDSYANIINSNKDILSIKDIHSSYIKTYPQDFYNLALNSIKRENDITAFVFLILPLKEYFNEEQYLKLVFAAISENYASIISFDFKLQKEIIKNILDTEKSDPGFIKKMLLSTLKHTQSDVLVQILYLGLSKELLSFLRQNPENYYEVVLAAMDEYFIVHNPEKYKEIVNEMLSPIKSVAPTNKKPHPNVSILKYLHKSFIQLYPDDYYQLVLAFVKENDAAISLVDPDYIQNNPAKYSELASEAIKHSPQAIQFIKDFKATEASEVPEDQEVPIVPEPRKAPEEPEQVNNLYLTQLKDKILKTNWEIGVIFNFFATGIGGKKYNVDGKEIKLPHHVASMLEAIDNVLNKNDLQEQDIEKTKLALVSIAEDALKTKKFSRATKTVEFYKLIIEELTPSKTESHSIPFNKHG